MIVYTSKLYSAEPVDLIAEELEKAGIIDFEISPSISRQNISLSPNLNNLRVFVPPSRIYDQYTVEMFVRRFDPTNRAAIENESGYVILTFPRPIRMRNFIGLVKEIINAEGFCTILME